MIIRFYTAYAAKRSVLFMCWLFTKFPHIDTSAASFETARQDIDDGSTEGILNVNPLFFRFAHPGRRRKAKNVRISVLLSVQI